MLQNKNLSLLITEHGIYQLNVQDRILQMFASHYGKLLNNEYKRKGSDFH